MRTVLICVSGTSPAIITETLQALAEEHVHVDEMHVVTTTVGRGDLLTRLRGPGEPFRRLCQDYAVDEALLRYDHIHVATRADGTELADITNEGDAALLANQIGELVRQFTAPDHPDTRVVASLAGGRKTMSFWLGCAMSLFGRSEDRLTHVLVNEPFEVCRDFFYRPRAAIDVTVSFDSASGNWKRGDTISTAKARITLGYVPFPQFRPLLRGSHWLDLGRPLDIKRLIADINLVEAGPTLAFDDENRTLSLGAGRQISFGRSGRQYALYRLCAEVAAGNLPAGAKPAQKGVLTIEDFVAGDKWAARRLHAILGALGNTEEQLFYHLDEILGWTAADDSLWHDVVIADREAREADRRLKAAIAAVAAAKRKLAIARNAGATRSGKTLQERDQARGEVERASRELQAAEAELSASHRNNRVCKARKSDLDGQVPIPDGPTTAPELRRLVGATMKALQDTRVRLNERLDASVEDFNLCDHLRLIKDEKPFAIGLHPRLRDPCRISL